MHRPRTALITAVVLAFVCLSSVSPALAGRGGVPAGQVDAALRSERSGVPRAGPRKPPESLIGVDKTPHVRENAVLGAFASQRDSPGDAAKYQGG